MRNMTLAMARVDSIMSRLTRLVRVSWLLPRASESRTVSRRIAPESRAQIVETTTNAAMRAIESSERPEVFPNWAVKGSKAASRMRPKVSNAR